jgi:uridine phosphorylase
MAEDQPKAAVYSNTNGFPLSNGKTLHMDLSMGSLSQRVITVGAVDRAEKISKLFDSAYTQHSSSRGFTTFNGTFDGVPVSVVAIGMGISMMDFFVRESRSVVEPSLKMAIVRFGTCGGLTDTTGAGSIVVADGAALVMRNSDYFSYLYRGHIQDSTEDPYRKSEVAPANPLLSSLLASALSEEVELAGKIHRGVNITAESFYGSQGRIDGNFEDENLSLISSVVSHYSNAKSMEMETFQLLHLAHCSNAPIIAAAASIVVSLQK